MKKILTILLLTFIGITSAYAQLVNTDSNTRTLKFILSTGPGSGTDSAIETYAPCLRNQNINIVKEFKPGAEGFIAIQALQQSVGNINKLDLSALPNAPPASCIITTTTTNQALKSLIDTNTSNISTLTTKVTDLSNNVTTLLSP